MPRLSHIIQWSLAVMLASTLWLAAGEEAGVGAGAMPGAGGQALPAGENSAIPEESWEGKVVVIELKGVIIGKPLSEMPDQIMAYLDRADREKASLAVLEIDSPGGEVGICDTLSRHIYQSKTPVVALVLHKAVSGGAMVASAAKEIVMTRTARIGDIQPMQAGLTGTSGEMDERSAEKIEVDIRTIMKVYAENNRRPPAIMAGMVSRDMAVYQVAFDDGAVEYLDGHEFELLETNIEKGRDARKIASTKVVKPVGKLLELTAQQAVDYGVASEVVDSAADFYGSRGIKAEDMVRPEVAEGSFDLSNLLPSIDDFGLPIWVLVLLGVFLAVGVAGFVTELHAPGAGIPAAIGVIGFVCFFATLFMHDRGSPFGMIVFLIGIVLLVVEIMVLPGFGVAGILGILSILGGLFLSFTPDWNSEYMQTYMWAEIGSFTLLLLAVAVGVVLVVWIIANFGDRLPLLGRFTLKNSLPAGSNPYTEAAVKENSAVSGRRRAQALVGKAGLAETMLRPAGKVRLDSGELIDVVTDGGFVEAGTRVAVKEAAPGKIVVVVSEKR